MEEKQIQIAEAELTEALLQTLIRLSEDWEAENICYGYRKNGRADIEGNRVFLARRGEAVLGYLFGHVERSENAGSIMPDGTAYFEVEELYVRPEYRGRGLGRQLFACAEQAAAKDAAFLMLSTATKNWRAILHFYLEELDMSFWSARLYKRIRPEAAETAACGG